LVFVMFALAGCGEAFTYANKSREEGMRLYSENAYGDAAGAYRTAIRQDPRDYKSQFYLGVCYDQMNEHQQAFSQYRITLHVMANTQAGKEDPDFRQMVLDTLATSVARYDQGEVELNQIESATRGAQSAEDWFLLAKVYRLRGDADRAIDAYRRAARWDSE